MKTSRIDWAKFISEEAKISPVLKSDDLAYRFGMSESIVRRALLRLARRGLVEHFAKKWFINLLAKDFSGRELVNLVQPQSYISLETVLREAGIISQTPVPVTCVTTGLAGSFRSTTVSINFRHLPSGLYWGFQKRRTLYGEFNVADPEKALLDWLYFQGKQGAKVTTDEFDLRKLDIEKVLKYGQKYPKPVQYELLEALVRSGAALPNSTLSKPRESVAQINGGSNGGKVATTR
jgi:hypothetical protein